MAAPVVNDIEQIFEEMSYGPVPEADNVVKVRFLLKPDCSKFISRLVYDYHTSSILPICLHKPFGVVLCVSDIIPFVESRAMLVWCRSILGYMQAVVPTRRTPLINQCLPTPLLILKIPTSSASQQSYVPCHDFSQSICKLLSYSVYVSYFHF